MQHSKSLGSFVSDGLVPVAARPRARSSLDTFLIPGRTRIPSSRPEAAAMDLQIAETLLHPNEVHHARVMSGFKQHEDMDSKPLLDSFNEEMTASDPQNDRSESVYSIQGLQEPLYNVRSEISERLPPRIGGREVIIVPPRRPRKNDHRSTPPKRKAPSPIHKQQQRKAFYDGTTGSSYESRQTSQVSMTMTWSTGSHISRRMVSNSSGNSQGLGAFESLGEYNRIATHHGLPELEKCPGDEHLLKKSTEKLHQHNWLARKLFHRSSSTYTLKVKNAPKPVKHKKSLGVIPRLEEGGQRNIFKDKNLEETCRLGGLGILILPKEFAVGNLTLPTCLSATGTYLLQHGLNTPGLFRTSGQSTTVNALHGYYASQFTQAGSPSKVQETVGSGILPTHIEHTVPDIASLFKKILITLPGGLLGSLELFEALRSIFFKMDPRPTLSDADVKAVQAKLIALAISSVTSVKRTCLIQGVIGLVAYIGHEAEEARKVTATATDETEERLPSSELMGYQSLGVVLGPLLLGDLTDRVDASPPATEEIPRASSESTRKTTKKQKRASIPNKLDRDATLTAHVDRANLTANIMKLLLIIWKDVVDQSRQIRRNASTTSLPSPNKELGQVAKGIASTSAFGTSDEEVLMNMLRGRPLPDDFKGKVKMKRRVRVSSRSPMARGFIQASEGPTSNSPAMLTSSREIPAPKGKEPWATGAVDAESDNEVDQTKTPGSSTVESLYTEILDHPSIQEDQRSKSEQAMEQMSMGTILQRLQDDPITPLHKDLLYPASQPHTPPTAKLDQSSSVTPETALRDVPKIHTSRKLSDSNGSLLDKPLPPIGEAQLSELSPPQSDEECDPVKKSRDFPARISSLPENKSKPLPSNPFEPALESSATEYSPSTGMRRRSATKPNSRRISQLDLNQSAHGDSETLERSERDGFKLLAQQFGQVRKFSPRVRSLDSVVPKIYAQIHPLLRSNTAGHDDPFLSSNETSPERSLERDSRIPKPAQDVGQIRKPFSYPPSPPKFPPKSLPKIPAKRPTPNNHLKKRPSVFNIVPAEDVDTVTTDLINSPDSTEASRRTTPPLQNPSQQTPPPRTSSNVSHIRTNSGNFLEVVPTRSLAAYSSESLHRMRLLDEPPVAQHIPNRVVSIDINTTEAFARVNDSDSPERFEIVKRTGSMNATLLAEIGRLKRRLDQKERETNSMRRSLDAVRDAREAVISLTGGESGSISKGTLSEEVRQARKEAAEWKRRAEWAESRLKAAEEKIQSVRRTPRRGREQVNVGSEKITPGRPSEHSKVDSGGKGTPRRGSEQLKIHSGRGTPRNGSEIEKPKQWLHE